MHSPLEKAEVLHVQMELPSALALHLGTLASNHLCRSNATLQWHTFMLVFKASLVIGSLHDNYCCFLDKPGRCPVPWKELDAVCDLKIGDECERDNDCKDNDKCCFNGCRKDCAKVPSEKYGKFCNLLFVLIHDSCSGDDGSNFRIPYQLHH